MNALVDIIPPKGRKYLYAVLAAALAVYAIWQAVDGDWTQFSVALATALVNIMAAGNVNTTPVPTVYVSDVTGERMTRVTLPDGTEQHFIAGE